jgi:predicted nucleotidyltransferase
MIANTSLDAGTARLDNWLPEMVSRIAKAVQPEAIWLFGSRARGDFRADSDFDLLIILPRLSVSRHAHAIALRQLLADIPAPKDLLVVSSLEFEAKRTVWGTIPYEAAQHGKLLYAAA